jgi:putative two-component system response regulator
VLIVDDTPGNLAVLGELLAPTYDVRVANSGERALLAAVTEPHPDLVLLDIMMPGMDGYEVLRQLKADPRTAEIPVVFITALDHDEDEARGLALGATDYIAKPIRPAIVLARVRTQLELKAARDLLRNRNAWLDAEVRRRLRQNQTIQDVSLRALASLAEARDQETGNHIMRTQGYVNVLALQLASSPRHAATLTPELVEMYTKAAPLHDIGKVGIPDSVLGKPGKLDAAEWDIMKTHARVGAEAIWRAIRHEPDYEGIGFLHHAMDIAGSHHEHWDGTGYPDGLVGEAIPLSARLMALADVFDALISRRVYKDGVPFKDAVAMITAGRGSHFDPDIVDAFIAREAEFQSIARRFSDDAAPALPVGPAAVVPVLPGKAPLVG